MTTFSRHIDSVKQLPWQTLQAGLWSDDDVEKICADLGHRFRRRLFCPALTLKIWILQVLFNNTAITDLRHKLQNLRFNPSAYCQARQRLPVELLRALLTLCARRFLEQTPFVRSLGPYRVFYVDGTSLSMPDTPALADRYGKPTGKRRVGYPVMHALMLMDAATGYFLGVIHDRWNTSDFRNAQGLHPLLRPNDLLIGDRAFCSWTHMAMLQTRGIYGLFRAHQAQNLDFSEDRIDRQTTPKRHRKGLAAGQRLRLLGIEDQWVVMDRPASRPAWIDADAWSQLPAQLTVRQLRVRVQHDGFRPLTLDLLTTMLGANSAPSKEALVALYLRRWQIEVRFRDLKHTMQGGVLKCQTARGVECESLIHLLVCNLITLATLEESRGRELYPDRVSFVDASRWLQSRWWQSLAWIPQLCPIALQQAGFPPRLITNPHRPGRQEPRVLKRRKDRYTYMTKPRNEYPQSHTYRSIDTAVGVN